MKAKIVTGHGAVIHYEARTPKIRVLPAAITTPRRGVDYWTEADQQAIAAEAQSAAEAAAEATATEILNAPEYKASIKGDKGDTGDPGYTPVKGVDYFDGQDGAPGKDGQDGQPGRDGQDGAPGQNGQDGVSPTITVTDITGGHRVTITDATGPHSFDVMDGESGQGAVQDVQVAGVSVLQDGVANVPMASASAPGVVISGSVSVGGTTPTINALPGIRYVCGEVTTLDIALPASGIVDVVFESGSTPTVLTVTQPMGVTMKWANGFDPASLEANTTYEINIADGCLGVAGQWT